MPSPRTDPTTAPAMAPAAIPSEEAGAEVLVEDGADAAGVAVVHPSIEYHCQDVL